MYEAELLPQMMAMGISYEEFWSLTPRKINVIIEGYKLRRKVEDEKQWLLGGYMFEAVSIALGNAFRKKNQKQKSYFELVKKSFMSELSDKEMSEEDIQKKRELLMAQLRMKQANFELSKGNKV